MARLGNNRLRVPQVNLQGFGRPAGVPQPQIQSLVPETSRPHGVGLLHREALDCRPVAVQPHADTRPATLFHPRSAPGGQILGCQTVQNRDQVRPACIAIRMGREVLPQSVA